MPKKSLFSPNPVYQDAPFNRRRSRFAQKLNARKRCLEIGSAGGAYPFAKTHGKGELPTRSKVCTSSTLCSLRPYLGQGVSWRVGVGQVRRSPMWAFCMVFSCFS